MNHAELFANLAQHGVHPMRGAAAADQSSATSIVEYVRSQLTTYAPGSITNQVIEDAFVGACLLGFTGQGKTSLARSCRYALAESPNETVYPTEMLTAPQGMTASKTLSFGAYRMVNSTSHRVSLLWLQTNLLFSIRMNTHREHLRRRPLRRARCREHRRRLPVRTHAH
jgi:hypothetical protein